LRCVGGRLARQKVHRALFFSAGKGCRGEGLPKPCVSGTDSRAECKKCFLHSAVVRDLWLVMSKNNRLPENLEALASAPKTCCTGLIQPRKSGLVKPWLEAPGWKHWMEALDGSTTWQPSRIVKKTVTVQYIRWIAILQHWIPAFAGMTHPDKPFPGSSCRRMNSYKKRKECSGIAFAVTFPFWSEPPFWPELFALRFSGPCFFWLSWVWPPAWGLARKNPEAAVPAAPRFRRQE